LVEGGVVGAPREGGTLDLGYHGLLALLPERLAPHAEIRLDLRLPLIDHAASGIYARVVKASERDGRNLAAFEFTSISDGDAAALRRFVQMLV
jgi:c-di-GMP-binding flagellar brake protein YcgR